jgi:ABC-type multidrug transport system ATPase subunit
MNISCLGVFLNILKQYGQENLSGVGGKRMELQVEHLFRSYRRKEALRDVNFRLKKGTYGLLGENGAGKSTLMRIMSTVDLPTKGNIRYDGTDIFLMDEAYRSLIGYMPQNYNVYPGFTARDFLEYMGVLKGMPKEKLKSRIDEVLEFVNLSDVAGRKVKTFSGGMKRRIGIAQAIINEPEILILDEPTAGLDPKERIRFSNMISDMGKDKIVLLSTHIVSDIEAIASELIVMKNGEVLKTGNVDELVQSVKGQVWETVVNHEVYQELRKRRSVIHLKQMGKEVQVRFVGENYTGVDCRQVEPTLEDYYIYTGGINID